jgi:hypothetical protein
MARVASAVVVYLLAAASLGCQVEGGGLAGRASGGTPAPGANVSTRGPDASAARIDAPVSPPRDASVAADDGSQGINTARPEAAAVDVAPPPIPQPPPPDAAAVMPPPTTPPVPPVDAAPPPADEPGSCPRGNPQLSLCLRFEGSVVDESQHGVQINSSNVRYQAGLTGMAANIGPGSRMHIAEMPLIDAPAITIEAWLSPRALPGPGLRQGIADNAGQYGLFLVPPANVLCIAGTGTAVAPNVLRVNNWVSVACTFDSRAVTVWIDGRRVAETPSTTVNQGSAGGLSIGLNNPSGENFDGLLDNFRLWRTLRSAAQICAAARGC